MVNDKCFFLDHDEFDDVVDDDDDDVKHCYSHRKGHFPNTDRGSLNESHMLEQ